MTIIIGLPPLHEIKWATVIFAPVARYQKQKKPGAVSLGCPRLQVSMIFFFLRGLRVKPWADPSKIAIIIVVKKSAHLFVASDVHTRFLYDLINKFPRLSLGVKKKQ
jgi:hypothetical protein